jgi:hypothetical protein
MKVFISWSGPRSRAIAEALSGWLPNVIQNIDVFYSPEIEKGTRGTEEINAGLEGTDFGILCLTPDNRDSTWIHFEAGAISKMRGKSRVWTLLYGLKNTDLEGPLAQFQHTQISKEEIKRLLTSIDANSEQPLGDARLTAALEKWWPELAVELGNVEKLEIVDETQLGNGHVRSERELIEEVLELVRFQQSRSFVIGSEHYPFDLQNQKSATVSAFTLRFSGEAGEEECGRAKACLNEMFGKTAHRVKTHAARDEVFMTVNLLGSIDTSLVDRLVIRLRKLGLPIESWNG